MPVDTTTAESAMVETAEGRLRDVHATAGGRHVPRALGAIARKAMTLEAEGRYADSASLVADLRAWLEDREVSASPDDAWRRAARWLRHHRVAATLIGGTLASTATAAIIVLALVSGHNAERARLAERAQSAAERASAVEHAERERLERRATAFSTYLPGLDMLERAEWNQVWAPRALEAFDRALAVDPDFAEAHRARARALNLADRHRDALAAYERALALGRAALGRDDPELMRRIGDLLWMQLNDIPAATAWFRRAADADPSNPHARVAKAIVRSMDGDHAGGIADLRALVAEAPDWWEVQQTLGMLLLGSRPREDLTLAGGSAGVGDLAGAVEAFSQAIRLRPGYAWLYVRRGMARTMQYFGGDQRMELLEGCLADYDTAVLLAPEWVNAHTVRLEANFYMKRNKVVQEELAILRRKWPKDPAALRARAKVEVPAGHGKALLAEVEAALAELPDSPDLLKLRDKLGGKADKPAPSAPATPEPE
jgi:tetratricopeptide (TPR) repeat protein